MYEHVYSQHLQEQTGHTQKKSKKNNNTKIKYKIIHQIQNYTVSHLVA